MASTYYPGAYGGPNLDFSFISDLGGVAGDAIGKRMDTKRYQEAWGRSGGDYNKMVQELYAVGDVEGANKIAKVAYNLKPQGMTPAQQAQLDISRERLDLSRQQSEKPKIGSTLEGVRIKLAQGTELTAGEKKLYEDSLKNIDPLSTLLGLRDPPTATPENVPESAAPEIQMVPNIAQPSQSEPAIPEALKLKPGLQWSPSKQRFRDSDGNIYNQQGVPVSG